MGFSLGEIVLLILVGIIVVGPKNLPGLMRTAGQWIARIRRMSTDLRSQSGIDDLLRQEGLEQHIHELRSLSRFNVVESLMAPAAAARPAASASPPATGEPQASVSGAAETRPRPFAWTPQEPLREREYPLAGCDAYGALPDDMPLPPSVEPSDTADAANVAPVASAGHDADPYAPGDDAAVPAPAPSPEAHS